MCGGRLRPGDGFNGNGPIIKVDVATRLELTVYLTYARDQDFIPTDFQYCWQIAPSKYRVPLVSLDPASLYVSALLVELEQEMPTAQ